MTPRATYRLQFNAEFTFADGARIAPYIARLGVSHVYASPILSSRTGSSHGYDGVDPTGVDLECGGEEGLRAMVAELRSHGLGLIADIVPNHMAVGGSDNAWWLDVLENGEASPYAGFFDIDWQSPDPRLTGKVLAPFLGAPYGETLASGEIVLVFDEALESFAAAYHHHRFPIRPQDYPDILRAGGEDFAALVERFEEAQDRPSFIAACRVLASMGERLQQPLAAFADADTLHALLEKQNFRLAWWRVAGDEINWRRFFDITELAGLRVEDPAVFALVHGTTLRLYREGLIDGVRIDHIDGLRDPAGYCRMLRERLDELEPLRPDTAPKGAAYLIVEKILGADERLPNDWRVDGTTGYDFMNAVNGLQHDAEAEDALSDLWSEVSGRYPDFESEELDARNELLVRDFAGQLDSCARAFHALAIGSIVTRDITLAALRRAITTLIASFPAYRTYATAGGAPGSDAPILAQAVDGARELAAPGEEAVIDFIAAWLSGANTGDPELRGEAVARFQQLSAPIAAKAVEDTAFYRYGRLLSRNDVGFDAGRFAYSREAFHTDVAARAQDFPAAMLATATHDHKRGEDVRARLAAISEDPLAFAEHVSRWFEFNRRFSQDAIDPSDEYMLYQMIVGAWPLELDVDDADGLSAFADRLAGWQMKALREAKVSSSWRAPDENYETSCRRFLETILNPTTSDGFLADISGYIGKIAHVGALNGITQAFLRSTIPGVPDLFQGCEFWDFSLVDPDNRRPVDFALREEALEAGVGLEELMENWRDGRIKQAVIHRVLQARITAGNLFVESEYIPLEVRGARASSVIAFARRRSSSLMIAAACRLAGEGLRETAQPVPPRFWWRDTAVIIPPDLVDTELSDAFEVSEPCPLGARIEAASLFRVIPVALRYVV